ncbi:MAG: hypothetical protein IJD80_02030, partial [Oscillospiraceae bacterium]|nr:hypothetical protein [Oscillospiraceae bacterium]
APVGLGATEHPFTIMKTSDIIGIASMVDATETTHTVSIELDTSFKTPVYEMGTVTKAFAMEAEGIYVCTDISLTDIIPRAVYNVTWDSEIYKCEGSVREDGTSFWLGDDGTNTSDYPFKIEITSGTASVMCFEEGNTHTIGVELDINQDEILDSVEIELDFSNGNQTIEAGEGYVVKTAVIQKPDTLTPENILADVNIAGIIGTATAGGGGGNIVTSTGTFTGVTNTVKEITHNLGIVPDLIYFHCETKPTTTAGTARMGIGFSKKMMEKIGLTNFSEFIFISRKYSSSSSYFTYATSFSMSNIHVHDWETSTLACINSVNDKTFKVGSSVAYPENNTVYTWIAIGGLT